MADKRKKASEYNYHSSTDNAAHDNCSANVVQGNDKVCSNLFRAISHELRTPLASIVGSSITLQENWELLSELEKIASVTKIYEDSDWLIRIVENLLAVTRMREDVYIRTTEELVEEVISDSLQKLERRYPNCMVHVQIPENYIFLPMDALLIEQVIINLLENALNRSLSTAPVDMLVEKDAEQVSFTVRDQGKPIPEDILNNPFDGAAASTTTDALAGWGIMLVTCKAILDAHRGTLTARNYSHGAEFIFTLPKTKEEKA